MRSSAVLLAAALAVGGLGCGSPESFVVLALESFESPPITGVQQLTVVVSQGPETKTLTYPAASLSILPDASAAMGTLSIGFSGSQSGDVRFDVTAIGASGCAIGSGAVIVTIRRGATVGAVVPLTAETSCPGDAGVPDMGLGSTFPGCDPAGTSCPTGQSCQIDCQHRSNVCAMAGPNGPGSPCAADAGCTAGSQCFDYTGLGCPTRICQRLCASDDICAAALGNGVGPGTFCRNPVVCSAATAYDTCSFSCDPTAAAAAGGASGCPTALSCLLTASMDHVDCACPEATRTGKENAACTSQSQCAPGFLCEQTCRAVCLCKEQSGACTAANDCPTAGTTCQPVAGQTVYGVCL
ncbi:MAG TPA: hypothetical protein VHO06_12350 [Polyangia bacterium]|nr:hypothetical protein [Polyangia bacterium]